MKRLNKKYEVTDEADYEINKAGCLVLRGGIAFVQSGGRAFVRSGGMSFKYEDMPVLAGDGQYELRLSTDGRYYAGCLIALTAKEALAHWDREDDRACLFTIAIGMIENAK